MPTKSTKTHLRNPIKVYLLIMTLVGVIGTLISLGIVTFSTGKQIFITDEEYILGDRYYELESCKYNDYDNKEETKATPKEIEQCESEKTDMLIKSRKVNFKEDLLGGAIR